MGTCNECRWWGTANGKESQYSNAKICQCPKVLFVTSRWFKEDGDDNAVVSANDQDHVLAADECGVMDGSGYAASLVPGPDFGCVHWEAKAIPVPLRRRTPEEVRAAIKKQMGSDPQLAILIGMFGGVDGYMQAYDETLQAVQVELEGQSTPLPHGVKWANDGGG